jgi:hypothetical protein
MRCWRLASSFPALLTLAGAMIGCGQAERVPIRHAHAPSSQDEKAGQPPTAYSIRLQGKPALTYEADNRRTVNSPLARRIQNHIPHIRVDPCLQRAAAAHLQVEPDIVDHLPLAFTEFALHWAGCPDATATLIRLHSADDADDVLLEHLSTHIAEADYSHIGVARANADHPFTSTWLALLVNRRFTLQPFATSTEPGVVRPLVFRVDQMYDNVAVAVTDPEGNVSFIDVGLSDGWAVAGIKSPDQTGREWIELLGYGAAGPQVLALFPVAVGGQPPEIWVGVPRPDESWISDPADAENFAATLLLEDRRRFDLPQLERDPLLDSIARSHSADMASSGQFAHVLTSTGSIVDRLNAHDYQALFAAENIAMGASLTEAQEGLMRSPGHRAAILSGDATHFGVGVNIRRDKERGVMFHLTQVIVSK